MKRSSITCQIHLFRKTAGEVKFVAAMLLSAFFLVNSIAKAQPVITIDSTINVTCNGGTNGAIYISVTGGILPYTYNWQPSGQSAQDATGLSAGTHTVIVTDSVGEDDTASVNIIQPPALTLGTTSNNVSCYGSQDGTATVTPSGGTSPYAYLWSSYIDGQCTPCDTAVPTFNVDLSSQSDTTWISPAIARNGLCCGADPTSKCIRFNVTVHPLTEQIALDIFSGGFPPGALFYQINCGALYPMGVSTCITGATNFCIVFCKPGLNVNEYYITAASNCTSAQTDSIATGLGDGTYIVSVTDTNGCTATDSVTITQPPALTIGTTLNNVTCFGACDGTATANVSGGTTPYNYIWSNGDAAATIDSLCPGTYCVTVTDTNGCSDSACVIITQPPALTIAITKNNVNCFGACDGTATANVSGGTTPYTFQWNDSLSQTTPAADSLCNGVYTVVVTDSNGCVITSNVLITQPQELNLTISSITSSTCGNNNGTACVSIVGGVFPYFIQWNDPNFTNAACIDSVYAGVYTVWVLDNNGCVDSLTVIINDIAGPVIDSIVTTNSSSCNCNGTAIVYTSSGTAPFTYVWKDSAGDTIGTNSDSISGLCGGTYIVINIDSNGCVTFAAFTINAPAQLNSVFFSPNPVNCNGLCDGDAFVFVTGGTPPYTYSWSNGDTGPSADSLCAGLYSVIIVDSLGCSDTNIVNIPEPAPLQIIPTVTDVSCFGNCDGVISLNVTGGTPFYAFVWLPPGTGNNSIASNLCAGTYCVTVTDIQGCTADTCVTVIAPLTLIANGNSQPATCGNANGTATVSPSGGTAPYTFLWDDPPPPQTNDTAFGLSCGPYNVLITDANGCTFLLPIPVFCTPEPVIDSILSTDVTCNGICEGTASVSVSGGNAPYTYLWSNGDNIATTDSLCAGTHTITISDLDNCIIIDSVFINEPDILEVILSGDTTICKGDTAQISLAISGGVAPYIINTGWGWPDSIVSPSATTTYIVTVTDSNGCVGSDSATVIVYLPLSSSITAIDDTICAGTSATLTASASGGNGGPYTYTWLNDGSIDSNVTVSPATDSTFTVVVSDGGCSLNDTSSVAVVVEICLGINNQSSIINNQFKVYPNPNTGEFTIEAYLPITENGMVRIYGIRGELVKEYALNKGKNTTIFNTYGWAKGVYVCRLELGGKVVQMEKLVVE